VAALDAVDDALGDATLVVNCTSVGHDTQAGVSPLGEDQLALLPADAGVFDVIYNPRPTRLLELAAARGLRTVGRAGDEPAPGGDRVPQRVSRTPIRTWCASDGGRDDG
jgi:hypothetical protein